MGKTRETADLTSDTLMTPNIDTDVIDVGSSIKLGGATGIITATTFSGALSGTASLASGLTGTPNINVGVATATSFNGELHATSLLKEEVNITAGKLSDNTDIYLENGMVHLFTTTETTTSTQNIEYSSSTSIDDVMSIGESITIVIITTAAAAGYSASLQIATSPFTVEWLGGSAPTTGGSSGYDVYTYNIIKTGSGGSFVVLANLVNFA